MPRFVLSLLIFFTLSILLVSSEDSVSITPSPSSVLSASASLIFEPTDDWKEVLPGQSIEPGLHVRMDMTTGQKWAKKLAPEDRNDVRTDFLTRRDPSEGNRVAVSNEEQSMIAVPVLATSTNIEEINANDFTTTESDTIDTDSIDIPLEIAGFNRSELRMAQILEQLPVPESELHDAVMKKLPPEELRMILQKVWARRQAELKEAFADAKTEAQQMQLALSSLVNNATLPEQDVIDTLENLEYFVATMHNAEDFAAMGGLMSTTMLLHSPPHHSLRVATAAAWVLGTAIKGNFQLQTKALQTGAAPLLINLLDDVTKRCSKSFNFSSNDCLQPLKAANKAVYALSGLLRFNSLAQEELVALDAPSILLRAFELRSTIHKAVNKNKIQGDHKMMDEKTTVIKQVDTLSLKILNVLSDLFLDETSTSDRYYASMPDTSSHIDASVTSKRDENSSSYNKTDVSSSSSSSLSSSSPAVMTRVSLENGERLAAALATDSNVPKPTPAPLLQILRLPNFTQSGFCTSIQEVFKVNSKKTTPSETDIELEKALLEAAKQAGKALSCGFS
jgi:hypothetical protein